MILKVKEYVLKQIKNKIIIYSFLILNSYENNTLIVN